MSIMQSQAEGLTINVPRDLRDNSSRRLAIVALDFLYHDPNALDVYLVPQGFITDFASIPTPFAILLPPFGLWAEGAVIHDFLYAVGEPNMRKAADRLFLTAILEQGVKKWTARQMYAAVRMFGTRSYNDPKATRDKWHSRFGDIETGMIITPPYSRPATAIIARGISAKDFDIADNRKAILDEFTSAGGWQKLDP